MHKLILVQMGSLWDWYLQPIEPFDFPFDPARASYSGRGEKSINHAIARARTFVHLGKISYTYMDRHNAV